MLIRKLKEGRKFKREEERQAPGLPIAIGRPGEVGRDCLQAVS